METKKVPLLKGWDFEPSDYISTWKNEKLLTAQIENTNLCNCDCEYCFRGGVPNEEDARFQNEISRKQLTGAIDEMSALGVRAINIIGAGEPLMDKGLVGLLSHLSGLGITPVVATNGSLITPDLVDAFPRYHTSVILKMNSLDSELQDKLVRRDGFAEKRDYGLGLLMDSGFNEPGEGYRTRLGINSIVFQDNKNEVLDILRFCRDRNIMPVMSTFIPVGRTKDRTDQEVSMEEFLEISNKAREIDRREYGIIHERSLPYLGGVPCTQCGKASLYLTVSGDLFDCPGQLHSYGNIRNTSIKDALKQNREVNDNLELSCPPRLNYWNKTEQLG